MKVITFLQQHLGFTRNEVKAILVLGTVFLAGLGVRWIQDLAAPDRDITYDYRRADSIFAARSRVYQALLRQNADISLTRAGHLQAKSAEPRNIRLNSATASELEHLPGIGPAMAERILMYRRERGRFHAVDELLHVKGIGPKKLERIRPCVILD